MTPGEQMLLRQIEELRMQLAQLRSALGVHTPDEAESIVARMRHMLDGHDADLHSLARWARAQGWTP